MGNAKNIRKTFWNDKRIEHDFSLQDIGDVLRLPCTQISHYLTGQKIPPTYIAEQLCDLFDVEYDVGIPEFEKAHADWIAQKNIRVSKNTPKLAEPLVPDEVMEALYKVVSFNEFKEILNGGIPDNLLETLYNKVDFEIFDDIFRKTYSS